MSGQESKRHEQGRPPRASKRHARNVHFSHAGYKQHVQVSCSNDQQRRGVFVRVGRKLIPVTGTGGAPTVQQTAKRLDVETPFGP